MKPKELLSYQYNENEQYLERTIKGKLLKKETWNMKRVKPIISLVYLNNIGNMLKTTINCLIYRKIKCACKKPFCRTDKIKT